MDEQERRWLEHVVAAADRAAAELRETGDASRRTLMTDLEDLRDRYAAKLERDRAEPG
jgi:hypothetical protein